MRALALIAAPTLAFAEPAIHAQNPDEYGWWLGDKLEQRIEITLPPGVSIDPSTLPKPRIVDYWLDLTHVAVEKVDNHAALTLHWQNFYAAVSPDRRQVPASPIRLSDGSALSLPGFSFVASPLRPITDTSGPDRLQPDPPFHLIGTRSEITGMLLSLAAFTLSLGFMARLQAWWPFHKRAVRPFTVASRQLGRLNDPMLQRRRLHQAFDLAFGRVLISRDLPQFLVQRPEFRPLEHKLAQFFAGSNTAFFGAGTVPNDNVPQLARDLSLIERGQR